MKHEKKYEIMGLLDDRIYEEVLQKREILSRGRGIRTINRFRRVLLVAACIALLGVGMMSALLPAMLRDDPHGTGEGETVTESQMHDVDWVWDATMVKVERLNSVSQSFDGENIQESPFDPDSDMTTADISSDTPGRRLILIRFNCREGEQVVVTPSQSCAVAVAVQRQGADGSFVWHRIDPTDGSERYAEEYLSTYPSPRYPDGETVLLGQSLTVSGDTTLLWQYSGEGVPCTEDNFVDFTVLDGDGQVTGGGSIYVGGLDLIPLTENKTYYEINDVRLNAIYRPYVLGAYRCDTGTVEQGAVDELMEDLHRNAADVHDGLFEDLSADSFKLSMRKLKQEQSRAFTVLGEDGSIEITVRVRCYRSDDRYAIVENHDGSIAFFLYDGIYQRIETAETDTVGEYGTMLKGRYILTDGTVVNVDFSKAFIYEVVPPAP